MSILGSIMSAAQQHPDVNQEQHSSLVQHAIAMFGNRAGVAGLLSNAESQGLGHIVRSWIGNEPNQGIAPQQVEGLVGSERIQQFASRAGIPSSIASAALAHILPAVVDKSTPNGKLPQAA